MSIRRFFDRDVVVSRLRTVSGNKRAFSSTATVEGHIQEMDGEARQKLGIVEERAWKAWFDIDIDIQENDRITDANGIVYAVREVTKKDYGINQHLQVILMEHNA